MRFMVRTDGGYTIGLGNVCRSLALARQIEQSGLANKSEILFVTGYSDLAQEIVAAQGYPCEHMGKLSLEAEINCLREWCNRWQPWSVLVDVPEVEDRPEEFYRALRWRPMALVINLSDCHSGRHQADLVIEGDVIYRETPISGAVGQRPRYLRGPDYWILHPAFSSQRDSAPSFRKGILISFGGSDPAQLSQKILGLTEYSPPGISPVTIVLGQGVDGLRSCPNSWRVLQNLSPVQMAREMHQARIGIFSGGMTMYEAACLGLPSVIIGQNSGQAPAAQAFAELDVHIYLGLAQQVEMHKIIEACEELLQNPEEWQQKSATGRRLIDGQATSRIVAAMIQEME
jgi:spore coat polysaccharide biosynthesis predicted glycosyltransferase SpsG